MTASVYDIFISHASEDKSTIVKPIASLLDTLGVKVWYDEFTLKLGDSLSKSIDLGLANSKFGLIVLSPAFISKDWTEYELRGLVAKELGKDKLILPIWHEIGREEVLQFSPPLADKLALSTDKLSLAEICDRILAVVRPDLFEMHHAKAAYRERLKSAKLESVAVSEIKLGPIRHEKLPDELISRIRLIRAALIHVHPHTMEYWVDGFKRDMHPEQEILIWEHVAACFQEILALGKLSKEQIQSAFNYLACQMIEPDSGEGIEYLEKLPDDCQQILTNSWKSAYPAWEISGLKESLEEEYDEEELEKLKEAYSPKGT